jgi:hypothetical protein
MILNKGAAPNKESSSKDPLCDQLKDHFNKNIIGENPVKQSESQLLQVMNAVATTKIELRTMLTSQ